MALTTGTVARYAVGSVGTGGFATLPGLVLVFYLTDTLGVAAAVAGLLVTGAKVWDVVVDPVIGAASDRERATTGRRRRLMTVGGLALPVFFTLTFAVPPALSPAGAAAWVLVAFLLAATAFSLFQVPYIALPAEIAGTYDARTRLLTARVVVLTAAILLFGGGGPALRELGGDDERLGYLLMAVVASLVLGAALLVATTADRSPGGPPPRPAVAPEDRTPPARRLLAHYRRAAALLRTSVPFRTLLTAFVLQALATGVMLAAAQYVATWVLHSTPAVTFLFAALVGPALVVAPLWGRLARRVGKERAFAAASVLFVAAAALLVPLVWAPGSWVYLPVGLAGAAYAGMQSLPMAMLPDVVAHDARRHGVDRAGAFGGAWTAGETTGLALGTTVLTAVLAATGYVESSGAEAVTQPTTAVAGIVVAFSLLPAALVAASLLALRRYPLRRSDIDDATADRPARHPGSGPAAPPRPTPPDRPQEIP
ncbi:MFS transporter [Isoptericola sp. BMS4]|uniref:MFS transporter n=1 Tax=Isoptericola sp. BMS4 TaxID=2527875 RepID=UPI0014249134|nr:MFS transporter [Isoptericola sp. BMS4]